MDRESTFLAVAAAQTAVVAILLGVVRALIPPILQFLGRDYLALPSSGLGARLAHWTITGAILTVVGLYVAIPVAVAGYLVWRESDGWLRHLALGVASLAALPVAAYAIAIETRQLTLALILVPVAGLLAFGWLSVTLRLLGGMTDRLGRPSAYESVFFNVFVFGIVVVGLLAVPTSGVVPAEDITTRIDGSPFASFAFTYEPLDGDRGVLTVTHDGGDAIRSDHLLVTGSGFAPVAGVDQTEPGPWAGEHTERYAGQQAVHYGDTVRVGVAADCVIRVGYGVEGLASTLGRYECGTP